ncbi:Hypp4198 [Branchiostoma lanceolatum]|uniref:Hypp4198 protein n=1 Tax=Branchiostoma lanceolatum TaxID=7740 RepID=A0A8K0A5N7_BRALA|nr:Hypp4198 [Branchiostoma lanceolatum]
MIVEVAKFLFCVRYNGHELSFGWMFDSSDKVSDKIEIKVVNPGKSCGNLDGSLSTISIQAPVVVLAIDDSVTDKLVPNTLEQCRKVWEYDGGITVGLVGNSIPRLVSMATQNTASGDVAMSFFQTQDTSTLTTTKATHDNTKNITCIHLNRGEHTNFFFTVSPTHYPQTTKKDYTHYPETAKKDYTQKDHSTLQVSTTREPNLKEPPAPDYVLISVVVSGAVGLVLVSVLLWKVCSEEERAADDGHIWTTPPVAAFPGLLIRSSSLPTFSSKMASDDTVSCRSLPAVLHSIEPTYSEIPDDIASAQRPLPGLPNVYWEIPDDAIPGVIRPAYSEIPDDSGPNPFYASLAELSLHVVRNRRHDRRRYRSGRSIAKYGSAEQGKAQHNQFYRNATEVEGIRARRQMTSALVSQPTDQGVRMYVNVTDEILSKDVMGGNIAFFKLPNTYWPWEVPGERTLNTPRRTSLPLVTLPNTYWPWEVPGEGAHSTPRRTSLPLVTLPKTYWPRDVPGEETRNTPRRASLPLVTLLNTYWPWEIPGEGSHDTP